MPRTRCLEVTIRLHRYTVMVPSLSLFSLPPSLKARSEICLHIWPLLSPKGVLVPILHHHATELNGELRGRGLVERLLVLGQLLRHLAVAVVVDDLGAVADEQLGVDEAVNLVPDGLKQGVSSPYSAFGGSFRRLP